MTITSDLKRYYASSGSAVKLDTLEIKHTTFTNPYYIVNDFQDLTAGLENSAGNVTFKKYAFEITEPSKDDNGNQTLGITIDAVNLELVNLLSTAVEDTNNNPIIVTYRVYLSDDTTEPKSTPLELELTSVTINNQTISGTAEMVALQNKRFLNVNYTKDFLSLIINA